jgi:hypothetical protein
MKVTGFLTFAILLIIGFSSCSRQSTDETLTVQEESTSVETTVSNPFISAFDEDNVRQELVLDDRTCYCLMASWCPYSSKVMEIINNPTFSSVTKAHPLVFLYDRDEIDNLRESINNDPDHQGLSADELVNLYAIMDERKDQGKLLFPEALSDIPEGVVYYYVDFDDFPFERNGFPSAYNSSSGHFDLNPISWWDVQGKITGEFAMQMLDIYNKKENN